MKNSSLTKRTLISSMLSFVVCVSLLIGTTMAWFNDNASAKVSDIKTGNLDVVLQDEDGNDVEGQVLSFLKSEYAPEDEAVLWEPGCTYNVKNVYVKNNGNLALKYKLSIEGLGDQSILKAIHFSVNGEDLDETKEYHLMPGEKSEAIKVSAHMDSEAGNEYMGMSLTGVTISVSSSQDTVEYDSYDNWYDSQKQIVYQVIQGHDGHADPDDNGAALAGYVAIQNRIEQNPRRVEYLGFVYGDTTEARQDLMINNVDDVGHANYQFYKQYTVPALKSIGLEESKFHDTTPETYNFNATELNTMSASGQFVANAVKNAIEKSTDAKEYRVTYSAGGGINVPAEAIKYLLNNGYSEDTIKEHFMVVQHSGWNYNVASEGQAREIINPYIIIITDQNQFTGITKQFTAGKSLPDTVSVDKTSEAFVEAWEVAMGTRMSDPIINKLYGKKDVSDAGSHDFASNPKVLDLKWSTRNNGFDNRVWYSEYNVAKVKAQLCD